jgi:hypothetical protein
MSFFPAEPLSGLYAILWHEIIWSYLKDRDDLFLVTLKPQGGSLHPWVPLLGRFRLSYKFPCNDAVLHRNTSLITGTWFIDRHDLERDLFSLTAQPPTINPSLAVDPQPCPILGTPLPREMTSTAAAVDLIQSSFVCGGATACKVWNGSEHGLLMLCPSRAIFIILWLLNEPSPASSATSHIVETSHSN